MPVETDVVDFVNYSRRTQHMEMRTPAFAPGTRVLLVDQWVETGGTMGAGIRLIERQGGVVAGIAAVCIEENDGGVVYRSRYQCSTAVIPERRAGSVQPQDDGPFRGLRSHLLFSETS